MNSEKKRLGWTEVCCICGKRADCWNNPDPLRDGSGENCCEACNRLVIAARRKIAEQPRSEQAAFARMLRDLPPDTLKGLLFPS